MKKVFVGNLPPHASEDSVRDLFSEFGTVRSIDVVRDLFTQKCRGFGFIEMEGHEARAAISGLDGKSYDGNVLRVRFGEERGRGRGKKRR
jgi:RNA recognition motif-containing protein